MGEKILLFKAKLNLTLMPKKTWFFALALIIIACLALPFSSQALIVKSGDSVSVDEVVNGNFFGAGNVVTIDGTVNGDVFAAGNAISINGVINGDVFAAGSNIDISGAVNGNIRAAGSNINIRGFVERNVLVAGSNLSFSDGAIIGRHLTFAGANIIINAPVGGEIDGAGNKVVIDNEVGGNVNLEMGEDSVLILNSKTKVNGNLRYKSSAEADLKDGAVVAGEVNFVPWIGTSKENLEWKWIKGLFFTAKALSLLGAFIVGLILLYLAPKPMKKLYDGMKKKFWPHVGWGLVMLILTPIVFLLLLITVIGIPLAFILLALYCLAIYFAKVTAALVLGKWIAEKLKLKIHDVLSLLLGLILVFILMLIPIVGWMACFLIFLWSLGGWYQMKKEYLREMK